MSSSSTDTTPTPSSNNDGVVISFIIFVVTLFLIVWVYWLWYNFLRSVTTGMQTQTTLDKLLITKEKKAQGDTS
jgi:hypothetical protein